MVFRAQGESPRLGRVLTMAMAQTNAVSVAPRRLGNNTQAKGVHLSVLCRSSGSRMRHRSKSCSRLSA